jgi:signal peptidase I
MRIFFVLFLGVLLFGAEVKLTKVYGKKGDINVFVKKGVSGIVLCPYMNERIVCARAVSFGKKVSFYPVDDFQNDAYALPIVFPKTGDEIVFAKDYDRILIIAPNQEVYLKVKELYKNATVVSPDVFAAFLDGEVEKSDFIDFSKKMNIGRIIFILDKIYEVDSFSFYAIKTKKAPITAHYKRAFFTYFKNFDIEPVDYKRFIKD